jgi:glutamate--cysteine ligase
LLYDGSALDAAWDLVKHWTIEDHQKLRDAVPKLGLKAPLPDGRTLNDLAKQVLDIATAGLNARAQVNSMGDNESGFLNPLREIADSGLTNAERMLALYNGVWGGDVSKVYDAESY